MLFWLAVSNVVLPVFLAGSVVLAGAAVSNVDFIRPWLPVFLAGSVVLAGVAVSNVE